MSKDVLPPAKKLFANKNWQACYEHFLSSVYAHSHSLRSVSEYESMLKHFFSEHHQAPDSVTRSDIETYIAAPCLGPHHRGDDPSPATRNRRLSCLRSFYAFARSYTVLFRGKPRPLLHGFDPTAGIRAGKVENHTRRAFEEQEIAAFFAAIPRDTAIGKRDRALFLAYFATSRRKTEILDLDWGSLERVIFVEGNTTRSGWMYRWMGKGQVERDRAEYPEMAFTALKEYLIAADRWGKMKSDEPLFISGWGNRLSRSQVQARFHLYLHKAGLPAGELCLHSWRATHAVERYENNGKDIVEVSRHLRHKNIQTTLGYIEKRRKPQADTMAAKLAAKWSAL